MVARDIFLQEKTRQIPSLCVYKENKNKTLLEIPTLTRRSAIFSAEMGPNVDLVEKYLYFVLMIIKYHLEISATPKIIILFLQ